MRIRAWKTAPGRWWAECILPVDALNPLPYHVVTMLPFPSRDLATAWVRAQMPRGVEVL